MSIGIQACDVVLPGYVLSERIGSGGYAEVWRAEAPGGIEKAVKIVYGYYNDEFASQELKALERIKGVRHPFLLSLERFEVVNGRLAILTELADMSLDQRLSQCHADGLPGIPRDELLRYMSDAAEALDFLSQRHSLLHLDIKPENLLISGDHVKVADFGLVKELATRTQNSLVSGMTPTYAAPEMFDDEPSAHSDQYSLAIVYQQMLVGTLPFPGRTAAQLAKQHTQSEPQLNSLPPDDRLAVARALAKKPADRFPSCRAFVDVLLHRAGITPAAAPTELPRPVPAAPLPSVPDPDDTKPSSICQTLRRTPAETPAPLDRTFTQPVRREASPVAPPEAKSTVLPEPFVDEETVDIAVPEIDALLRREQPTLYVAAGGVGIQLLCQLRALTSSHRELDKANDAVAAIALDTDRDELREACSTRWRAPLSPDDTLHLPLRLPKSYDDSPDIHGWVSRRWLYNIPRSLETRGYRPLGRVALVDHAQRVRTFIDQKLQHLAPLVGSTDKAGEARDTTIRVVILAGTSGGTGAGIAIDLANAAKSLAATRGLQVEIHGFFVCTCFVNNHASPLAAANTYSLLAELSHATAFGNKSTGENAVRTQLFESSEAPFDYTYWVPAHTRTTNADSVGALDAAAKYLALYSTPDARATLRSCRTSRTPREQSHGRSLTLKQAGYASLADQKRAFICELASDLATEVKQYWFAHDRSADWVRLVREEQQAASVPKLDTAKSSGSNAPPAVVPVDDATPLALRARFKEYVSLEFATEVLRQIQRQRESRDDRGRPLILACDAKLIADTARTTISAIAAHAEPSSGRTRFTESPILRPLIAACSRRVLSHRIEKFDPKQPEAFLPANAVDELIRIECQSLLEESLTRPDVSTAITALIDLDKATALMLEQATADSQQCGSERRTLLFVPTDEAQNGAATKLRSIKPLAEIVPASVDDVIVVSEEAGISPQAIANGIERVFAGVADAARRLHTRIDVNWQSPI
jgi:serine/threonine protein kinase